MNKWVISLVLVFMMKMVEGHPLHLTVTTIDISDTTVQLLVKLFQDDFLNLLHAKYTDSICYDDTCPGTREAIQDYIDNHLIVELGDDRPIVFKITGFHREDVSLWVTLSAANNTHGNNLNIQNTLFTDWFGDQKNLVILSQGDDEQGLEFDTEHVQQSVDLTKHQTNP